jgi:splicing factor 3B subunit 2
METAVSTAQEINGDVTGNGRPKVKSKNQLRRLKQKQKKAGTNGRESVVSILRVSSHILQALMIPSIL